MTEDFFISLVARFILIFVAAIPTHFFYNGVIAWNFNLPQFTFWEIVLGIISGWTLRIAIARLNPNKK